MILKKIFLENIRSYEHVEIEFPSGSVLLSGDIGSGKTTILLAVEFVLFGLQPGQRGSSLLRSGKDSGRVSLEIEIDGKNVIIERGLERSSKTISQENSAIVFNGVREEISHSELKNRVLKLLNYPAEFAKKTNLLYKFTVYTPQEEMKQIILEDSQTRLNAIRHVFGVNKYKNIKENIAFLSTHLREEIRNKEGIIRDLDLKKQQLEERGEMLKVLEENLKESERVYNSSVAGRKEIEIVMRETKSKIDEKKRLEQEIEKVKVAIAGKKELISNMDKEIALLSKEIEEIKRLSFSEQELRRLEIEKRGLEDQEDNKRKENFELLLKVKSLKAKNMEILALKERIMRIQFCPICLQSVDNEYKKNIFAGFDKDIEKNALALKEGEASVKRFDDEMRLILDKRREIEKTLSEFHLIRMKLNSIKDKEAKLPDDEKRKESAVKDIEMLSSQVERLKDSIREISKYDAIFIKIEEEFKSALKVERDADLKRSSISKEIEITNDIIKEMHEEIKKKEDVKSLLAVILEIYDWLANKFSELIAFTERNVMLRLREEFAKLFNEWFGVLVPENFSVSLDEDFTPIIYQYDYELEYNYLSGGERTAVALAYRLALNKTINSMLSDIKTKNLVILDEPTDGFSEQQLDKMRDVLNELNVEQLIIVSHEQKIESFVEKVIRLRKEKGASVIVKAE
ncbi:AAA family ATPase [Candidatus Pacearchaeota archaeon]|nr:AAA family ATPase [Candidatus Pacearchaeota archaeon]